MFIKLLTRSKTNTVIQGLRMITFLLSIMAIIGCGASESNRSPIAASEANPVQGECPLEVRFTSSDSYDPDSNDAIVEYLWDVGDPDCPDGYNEANPTHTFWTPGTYLVHLTVKDMNGNFSKDSVLITVVDGSVPPDPYLIPPETFLNSGCQDYSVCPGSYKSIAFNVSGSDNLTLSHNLNYEWRRWKDGNLEQDWTLDLDGIIEWDAISAGFYDINVRAVDEDSNRDESPASCGDFHVFEDSAVCLDTEAPFTFISAGCQNYFVASNGASTDIVFGIGGNDNRTASNDLYYHWDLYKNGYPIKSNMYSYVNVVQLYKLYSGVYSFRVSAVDELHNEDSTPAICNFEILVAP